MPLVRKPIPASPPATEILFAVVKVQGVETHKRVAYGIINEEFMYVSRFKVPSLLP